MGKIKKRIISLSLLLFITISVVSLSGCTKKLSEEEAIAKVSELVDASYELNVIVYGEGLPTIEIPEEKDSLYKTVMENEKYNSTSDIKKAINEVFSSDYADVMITTAFVGIKGEIDSSIVYARYIDGRYGLAMLKDDIALKGEVEGEDGKEEIDYDGFKVIKYDTSTAKIKKISRRFVEAYVTSEDGKTEILVTLISENGVWKLDTPTY